MTAFEGEEPKPDNSDSNGYGGESTPSTTEQRSRQPPRLPRGVVIQKRFSERRSDRRSTDRRSTDRRSDRITQQDSEWFHVSSHAALGVTVIPHHRSSVRAVAHRFEDGASVSAFVGMVDGAIIEANEQASSVFSPPRGKRRGVSITANEPNIGEEQAAAEIPLEAVRLGRHKTAITAMLLHRDTLITASKDGQIKLWDVRKGIAPHATNPRATLRAPAGVQALAAHPLTSVLSAAKFRCPPKSLLACCMPDALLFSGGDEGALSVWNLSGPKTPDAAGVLDSGVLIRRVSAYGPVKALVTAGRLLISASHGKYLCFWDTLAPVFETCLTLPTGAEVCSLVVLGDAVFGGCADGSIRAWTLSSKRIGARLILRVLAHAGHPIRHLAAVDKTTLLASSDGGVLTAWTPQLTLIWSGGDADAKAADPKPLRTKTFGTPSRLPSLVGSEAGLLAPRQPPELPTPSQMGRLSSESQLNEGELRCLRLYKPTPESRLGLSLCSVSNGPAVAAAIHPDGIVAASGGLLLVFDVILSVNNRAAATVVAAAEMLAAAKSEVEIVVRRVGFEPTDVLPVEPDEPREWRAEPRLVGSKRPIPRVCHTPNRSSDDAVPSASASSPMSGLSPAPSEAADAAGASATVSAVMYKPPGDASFGLLLYRFTALSPIVVDLEPGSPAEREGLVRKGDVVLAVGGIAADGVEHVAALLAAAAADEASEAWVELLLRRPKADRGHPLEGAGIESHYQSSDPPAQTPSRSQSVQSVQSLQSGQSVQSLQSGQSGQSVQSGQPREHANSFKSAMAWLGLVEGGMAAEDAADAKQTDELRVEVRDFERRLHAALKHSGRAIAENSKAVAPHPLTPVSLPSMQRRWTLPSLRSLLFGPTSPPRPASQ